MTGRRAVHRWALCTALAAASLAHHIYRLYAAYLAPGSNHTWGFGAATIGASLALVTTNLAERFGAHARSRLAWVLVASAAGAVGSTILPFRYFGSGSNAPLAAAAAIALGAFVSAALVRDAYVGVLRPALDGSLVPRLLGPFRMFAFSVALLAVFATSARVGLLRTGLATAGALTAIAAAYPRVFFVLERRRLPGTRWLLVAATTEFVVVTALFVAVERWLPAGKLARYPDEVVYATSSDAHDYAVVAAPGGFELYQDSQLAASSLDENRFATALARPALELARNPAHVLLVFGGLGTAEREILADRRVEDLTVLAVDRTLLDLAAGLPWLGGKTDPARTHVVVEEPIAWIADHDARFDVIVLNLPAPLGYREGKYYTSYFFDLVSRRLSDGGLYVTSAASAFGAPEAFASVRATLEHAGVRTVAYHADVPALGVTSFLVASVGPLPERITTPGVALDLGRDLERGLGAVSTLYDQRVVATFRERIEGPSAAAEF